MRDGDCPVHYYFVTAHHTILLLYAYAKSRTPDLPRASLHVLADAVKADFP